MPASYIADLHVVSAVGDASATVAVNVSLAKYSTGKADLCAPGFPVKATVSLLDGSSVIGSAIGVAGPWAADGPARQVATATVALALSPMPQLWSPADPFLHNATVTLSCGVTVVDTLHSYVGIRTIELKVVKAPISKGCASRRQSCHSAGPPSPFSSRFNRDGEGVPAK